MFGKPCTKQLNIVFGRAFLNPSLRYFMTTYLLFHGVRLGYIISITDSYFMQSV